MPYIEVRSVEAIPFWYSRINPVTDEIPFIIFGKYIEYYIINSIIIKL